MLRNLDKINMSFRIILVLVTFWISCLDIWAQSMFEGKVANIDGMPLQFVNIVLLSRKDSTYIAGTTSDKDGRFSLPADSTGVIKASCIGYDDAFVERVTGTPFFITLLPNAIMLKDVSVTSSLPITRLENNRLVTHIKGTVLEKIGTARDVLGRLPGIIADNEGVSVFGKGIPNIYVNGQLVRNSNMLDQLSSTKIKKVELITEPGSRYDATVKSVIRITTERDLGEGWGLDNKSVVGYRDNFSLLEQVDLNYRNKGLDVFGMMQFDHSKTEGTSTNIQNTWGNQHYIQDVNILSHSKQQLYEGRIGFNYNLASSQTFGAYYEVTHKPLKTNSELETKSWINELLEETSAVEKNVNTKETTHLVDGYYNGNFGKWSVDATRCLSLI